MKPVLCIHVPDSSLYIICADKNSTPLWQLKVSIDLSNEKSGNWLFLWSNCRYFNFVFAEMKCL